MKNGFEIQFKKKTEKDLDLNNSKWHEILSLNSFLQRNSISPAEREKYSRPRSTPDPQHHDHMHVKKLKKEQEKDIGHVSIEKKNFKQ